MRWIARPPRILCTTSSDLGGICIRAGEGVPIRKCMLTSVSMHLLFYFKILCSLQVDEMQILSV
jgi:hypothetical protein